MNASASDTPAAPGSEQASERDDQPTVLDYGQGGVPLYVTVSWVIFIVTYVVVMAVLALPDLTAWMQH
jgi:hypothetical protein